MKPPFALVGLTAALALAGFAVQALLTGAAFVPPAQSPVAGAASTPGNAPVGPAPVATLPEPVTDRPVGDVSTPGAASSALFSVAVQTRQVGAVPAQPELVSAMDVPSHALVVPPVPAGYDDWRNTTVWVSASAFPTSPSAGTSYVYGHACTTKICPFTELKVIPGGGYTVQPGDQVLVSTAAAELTYRVCGVGSSSKSGDLVVPPCGGDRTDLVLVTCEYEDGVSRSNLVVASTLVKSDPH